MRALFKQTLKNKEEINGTKAGIIIMIVKLNKIALNTEESRI